MDGMFSNAQAPPVLKLLPDDSVAYTTKDAHFFAWPRSFRAAHIFFFGRDYCIQTKLVITPLLRPVQSSQSSLALYRQLAVCTSWCKRCSSMNHVVPVYAHPE